MRISDWSSDVCSSDLCISAIVLIATGIYGRITWLTTFLIRSHGIPIVHAGLMVAIAYGVRGSVGSFAAGWIADWFNKRRGGFEPSRTALFGATIPFMTALTGLGTVTSGSLEWTIAFMFACGFFSASYNGPIYAVIVPIAGAKPRGLAFSMVRLGHNLIGRGPGKEV